MKKITSLILFLMFALNISGQSLPDRILSNINQIIKNEFKTKHANSSYFGLNEYYTNEIKNRLPKEALKTKRNDILYVQIEAAYAVDQSISVTTWTKSGYYNYNYIPFYDNKVETSTYRKAKNYVLEQKYLKGKNRDFMPVPDLIYIAETENRVPSLDVYFFFFNIKYTIKNNMIVDTKVFTTTYPGRRRFGKN